MNELKVFDQLAADITVFVSPAMLLKVIDPASGDHALETAKTLKEYTSAVEKKRKELVGPLNAQVKAINDYCKQITAPLDEADAHVRSQLNAFAAEQARIVREEQARIERERIESERLAREERECAERALMQKQEQEAEALAESVNKWGAENGDTEAVLADINAKQEREWAEEKVRMDRDAAIRQNEYRQKEFDAKQVGVSNTRTTLKVRVLDVSLIPKEFLIITPNEKALVAVGKTGAKIPGVEFYEEFSVAIGRTTRMPKTG